MNKSTKYFIGAATIPSENYIIHYYFDENNFDGNNYIYNNTPYLNYTGKYEGINDISEVLNDKSGSLFFDESRVQIYLDDFYTNEFTFILNYEKTTNKNGIFFSSIKTGSSGEYYGFNVGVNDYNNLVIEYYDISGDLKYLVSDYNLDTNGILILKGFNQNLDVMYYNASSESFTTENFSILKDKNISVTGDIVLGSGNYSNLNNYEGYLTDFVFINKNLVESQANIFVKSFLYDVTSGYSFTRSSESYSYSNFPSNIQTIFDSYTDLTGSFNTFGDEFLENVGTISGSITGFNYSLDLTGITGYGVGISIGNFSAIKDNIKKIEFFDYENDQTNLILLNDGKITGEGDNTLGKLYGIENYVGDWTGSPVGKLSNVIDLKCKNRGCLALINGGTVTGWGDNQFGRIFGTTGFNNANNIFTGNFNNTPLSSLNEINDIGLGLYHSVFVKSTGSLISWGSNYYGQVAGLNDRENAFPLKLRINNIYPNLNLYSGLFLNYTGMVNSKPSYKLINDPINHGINLYYDSDINYWKFNYLNGTGQILLEDKDSMPSGNQDLPIMISIDNSNETGLNGNYNLDLNSVNIDPIYYHENYNNVIMLDNFNQPIINYFKIKRNANSNNIWSLYNGSAIIAYQNSENLINKIPTTGWLPITRNGYAGTLELTKMYISFENVYNISTDGIFTGIWNETEIGNLTGIKKLSVGDEFNAIIFNDSGVKLWGYNGDNSLFGNVLNERNQKVLDISCGSNFAVAILEENNTLTGWGDDSYGQVGDLIGVTGAKIVTTNKYATQAFFDQDETLLGWGSINYTPNLQKTRYFNSSEDGIFVKYVTGTQDLNLVSGNAYFNFLITPERPIYVSEDVIQITTGYELRPTFTGITGYETGFLKDFPDYYNTGFSMYAITGYTGVVSSLVITGKTTGIIDTIQKLSIIPYSYSFESGLYDAEKTGNYIYNFLFTSNISNVKGIETVYLDQNNLSSTSKETFDKNKAYNVTKISTINYTKKYSSEKLVDKANQLGIEKVIINTELNPEDYIEIYQFKINNKFNINLKTPVQLMKTSNSFRLASTGNNYLIENNGIGQALDLDYTTNTDLTLINHFGNYDYNDILEVNFVRFDQNVIEYVGQSSEALEPKDFIYLNGQKLVSGHHYDFDEENINFNNSNIFVTGLIHTAKSLIPYNVYGQYGYSNYFQLSNDKFSKNTTMIWVNGVRLKNDAYYELSNNDPYLAPDFYDKNSIIVYNNTDNFINQ